MRHVPMKPECLDHNDSRESYPSTREQSGVNTKPTLQPASRTPVKDTKARRESSMPRCAVLSQETKLPSAPLAFFRPARSWRFQT